MSQQACGFPDASCATGDLLQVAVNSIRNQGTIKGSTLAVAERASGEVIASAVFSRDESRNWSLAYWRSELCSRTR
jgi:hypothetical protein